MAEKIHPFYTELGGILGTPLTMEPELLLDTMRCLGEEAEEGHASSLGLAGATLGDDNSIAGISASICCDPGFRDNS